MKIYPKLYNSSGGWWAYVDVDQFYLETKTYARPESAIAALKRILNPEKYEVCKNVEICKIDQFDQGGNPGDNGEESDGDNSVLRESECTIKPGESRDRREPDLVFDKEQSLEPVRDGFDMFGGEYDSGHCETDVEASEFFIPGV